MVPVILVVIFLSVAVLPRAQASALFQAPFRSFPAGPGPTAVAVGDLDADGHLDLAVANRSAPSVSVLLGDGGGSFAPHSAHATTDYTSSVAVGDLNRDGRLDVAAAAWYGGWVSVLLGAGDGSFLPADRYATGPGRGSVTISDVDSDGVPDLLVSNQDTFNGNSISLLMGNGDGTFAPRTDVPVASGTGPSDVEVGDLDADGLLDLVIGATNGTFVWVLLGRADGTFGAASGFATGNHPSSVALGDLNADGRLDLVAGGEPACILLGNGDGSFGPRQFLGTGGGMPAIADLDEDARPDLVFTRESIVVVMLGRGDGSFGAPSGFLTGFESVALAVADVNHDGHLDVVTANEYSSTVSVLTGNGDGTLGAAGTSFAVGANPVSVAIGDVDRDSRTDVVAADYGSGTVSLLLGRAGGGFEPGTAAPVASYPVAVALADLDRDERLDLLVASLSSGLSVLSGAGDGTFGSRTDFGASVRPSSMVVGDLNGDGLHDVVTADAGPPGSPGSTVSVLIGNGDGTFRPKVDHPTGLLPRAVALADLDADGFPDLAVANVGSSTVSVLLGNGDGTFGPRTDFPALSSPVSLAVADLNHDGRLDIALANAVGKLSVMLGGGNGSLGAGAEFGGPRYVHSLAAADVDGDMRVDLLIASEYENGVTVMLGGGDGTFGPGEVYGTGIGPHSVAVGDLDGDGRPDLTVPNFYTNSVATLVNIGTGLPTRTLASLVGLEVEPDRVRLRWYAESSRPDDTTVLRATRYDDWTELGVPRSVERDVLEYEDASVIGGRRYGYRLATPSPEQAILHEVWVDVPHEAERARLWLRPTPSPGRLVVSFQLASGEPAIIEAWDPSGRRVVIRSVGSAGPGRHVLDLAAGAHVRPGIYLLRLTQAGASVKTKACVTR